MSKMDETIVVARRESALALSMMEFELPPACRPRSQRRLHIAIGIRQRYTLARFAPGRRAGGRPIEIGHVERGFEDGGGLHHDARA